MIATPAGTSWPSSHPAVLTAFTRVAARELSLGPVSRAALTGLDLTVGDEPRVPRRALPERRRRRPADGQGDRARCGRAAADVARPAGPPVDCGDAHAPRLHRLARHRPVPLRGVVRDLPARPVHRDRLHDRRDAADAARDGPRHHRGAHPDDHLLVPGRRHHRRAAVLRARALQRVRQPRADAGDLARRHQPARRHRRRDPHQRPAPAAVRLPLLPGGRSRCGRPLALGISIGRIGDLIIGDHLGKPTCWLLAWKYEGGTLAPPFNCVDEVCQAGLQGGHLETITRTGAALLDAKRRGRSRRASASTRRRSTT